MWLVETIAKRKLMLEQQRFRGARVDATCAKEFRELDAQVDR
jgi:hypothetical protein